MLNPNTSPTSVNHASKVQATTSNVQASDMQASTAPAFTITNNTLPADYEAHAQLDYARMKLDDVNHVFAVILNNELEPEQVTALLSMAWNYIAESQISLVKVHQYLEQS